MLVPSRRDVGPYANNEENILTFFPRQCLYQIIFPLEQIHSLQNFASSKAPVPFSPHRLFGVVWGRRLEGLSLYKSPPFQAFSLIPWRKINFHVVNVKERCGRRMTCSSSSNACLRLKRELSCTLLSLLSLLPLLVVLFVTIAD